VHKDCDAITLLQLSQHAVSSLQACDRHGLRGLVVDDWHWEVLASSVMVLELRGIRCVDLLTSSRGDANLANMRELLRGWGMRIGVVGSAKAVVRTLQKSNASLAAVLFQTWSAAAHVPQLERLLPLLSERSLVLAGCHNGLRRLPPALGSSGYQRALLSFYPSPPARLYEGWPWPRTVEFLPSYFGPPTVGRQSRRRRGPVEILVLGELAFDKRDYALLEHLAAALQASAADDPLRRVRVRLFGRLRPANAQLSPAERFLNQTRPLVQHIADGGFDAMARALRDAAFVLPLITDRPRRGWEYAAGDKMTSSVSLALAFERPLILWRELALGYARRGLRLEHQLTHDGGRAAPAGLVGAVRAAVGLFDNRSAYRRAVSVLRDQKRAHFCRAARALTW
tara:strand:- start:213 stop:1403 length:1191 start_codon:yes stop_codon:yes gene_type:complete